MKEMDARTYHLHISTAATDDAVFGNFEQLLGMADRALQKLQPAVLASLEIASAPSTSQAIVIAATSDDSGLGRLPPTALQTAASLSKSKGSEWGAGSNFCKWKGDPQPQTLPKLRELTFHQSHDVVVEEESLEAIQGLKTKQNKGKGLDEDLACDLLRTDKGKRTKTSSYKAEEDSLQERKSSLSDSSDPTWHAGTELSPSSCEYLCHSDTPTEINKEYSESEVSGTSFGRGSAWPTESTFFLRSGHRKWEPVELKSKLPSVQKRKDRAFHRRQRTNPDRISNRLKSLQMPRLGMAKQKENFQAWTKPVQGNVAQKRNPSNDSFELVQCRRYVYFLPRGMKRTHAVSAADHDVAKMEVESDFINEGNARGGKGRGIVQREGRKTVEPISSNRKGGGVTSEEADVQPENCREPKPIQRPGKERALTPSSDPTEGFQSPRHENWYSNKEPRKKSLRRSLSSDSEAPVEELRGRERDSVQKVRRRRSVDSGGSYDSRSPVKLGRGSRGAGGGGRHRRRERSAECSRHWEREGGRREFRHSDEGNYSESDGERGQRNRKSRRRRSPGSEEFRRRSRDYSHDEEDSGSSGDVVGYRGRRVGVKAEAGTLEVPKDETKKRQERRKKQGERETERRNRERQGLKGHYISVNHIGIPYGFGVGPWRNELSKLCRGLDPSVTNIQYQPEDAMATVRRRLKDHFEYSAPVDRAYIRKLAVKFVTQRRSQILSSMKEGDPCPSGMDAKIWRRLDRMRQDPGRYELSQRMKFANAARVNRGRTGPKGEDGIREDLSMKLGRSPDPEEVQFEMRRKKGYGRNSRKRKESMGRPPSPFSDEEDVDVGVEEEDVGDGDDTEQGRAHGVGRKLGYELRLMEKMEKELQQLRAQVRASQEKANGVVVSNIVPVSSLRVDGPASNATTEQEIDVTVTVEEVRHEKAVEEGVDDRHLSQQRNLRSRRKEV